MIPQSYPLYAIPVDPEYNWGISIVVGWKGEEDSWKPVTMLLTGPYTGAQYAAVENVEWLFFMSKEDAEAALLAR